MGNKKTPLLQMLRPSGGTMYVFPSAAEDIGLNLQSTTTGVAMSHFALLNIPDISIIKCLQYSNHDTSVSNGNEALGISLQNYAMNFETYLTNRDEYNYQKKETVSEKVFWKWLQHIGGINFSSNGSSSKGMYKVNTKTPNIYIEKAYDASTTTINNTVVKCFGSIDAGNQLSTEFGMFNETYINIPTSWGSGPVFFKQSNDENFRLGTSWQLLDADHLEGRSDETKYNSYTNGQDYPFFDTSSNDQNKKFSYIIDSSTDGFEILKDIPQIQEAARVKFKNDEIFFDSYDDINIDINNNLKIDTEFQFNTVLLYYSIYDQDDLVKTPYAINLFGVIFLDGMKQFNDNYIIPPLTKRKSSPTQFGNSYSFRVNLKTMSVYDNTDAIIQDNTTISSVDSVEFSDAISNMNRAIDIMNSNLTTTLAIQDQYATIINYFDDLSADVKDISANINAYIKGRKSTYIDTSIIYTNELRSSLDGSLNGILIRTSKNQVDRNGNPIYSEPLISIQDSSVIIPTLESTNMWNKNSYVVINDNASLSYNILDPSYNNDNITILKTLDNAFNTNTGFIIKKDENQLNKLYIDPDSPIFLNTNSIYNLKCLEDDSKNIDYVAIIPYLIAEVIKLKQMLKDANIYQNLDPLTIEELYNDIINNVGNSD